MATIKVKFRPSVIPSGEGTVFFQVIHRRIVRQFNSGCRLHAAEWDGTSGCVVNSSADVVRATYLQAVQARISEVINRLQSIIAMLDRRHVSYTAEDVIGVYRGFVRSENTFFTFMYDTINELNRLGKVRTGETYLSTLRSFARFRKDADLLVSELDAEMMMAYEAYLHDTGVSKNTSSFYMRILRAVYNRAVEKGLVDFRNPFKHVYTGVDKTAKRALPLDYIRKIRNLDLILTPSLEFARDMFMFSFYTRGMAFVDMAYLRKKDIQDGRLSYRRRKTGQKLVLYWESCMQDIVDKYDIPSSPYLLPMIHTLGREHHEYKNASHFINRKLKIIGKQVDARIPLTMYVARHSWASVAKTYNIPVSVISEGMGHESESTTRIYLASLDATIVDKANRIILNAL
ncbi:MAG: site-specific integrase [Clostridium sp.]|nr:site-specific integrase [Clostridium sp.]